MFPFSSVICADGEKAEKYTHAMIPGGWRSRDCAGIVARGRGASTFCFDGQSEASDARRPAG